MLSATAVLLNLVLLAIPMLVLERPLTLSAHTALFLVGASVLCFGEVYHSFHRAAPCPLLNSIDEALALATGVSILLASWIGLCEVRPAVWLVQLRPLAGALLALGIALRLSAIHSLGRFFVTGPALLDAQPLVTTGVYGLLRHPSDTGIVLATAGGAALLASPLAAVMVLGATLPLTIARVYRERVVLERGFGAAYRRYAAAVPAGLPDSRA
jgi:protein-S-isoprenylcysteine O-methyltransferase Ste14